VFILKALPQFDAWLTNVPQEIRGRITARLERLSLGLFGDVEPVGAGVSELRIHAGQGWRVYFVQRGSVLIVLLAGGAKGTQKRDIQRAKLLAALLDDNDVELP
jgi:putative addiction module killer protein